MKSRDTFSKYVYDLHETVNKMLEKRSGLSYADVRERYEHFRARCVQPDKDSKYDKDTDGKQLGGKRRTKKRTNKPNPKKTTKTDDERGCVVPLYGKKARCILQIVPQEVKSATIQIDDRCIKKKTGI